MQAQQLCVDKGKAAKNLCMKFSVDAEKLQVIKISLQLFNTVTFIAHCTTFKWVTNHRFGNVRKHVQQIADTASNISAKLAVSHSKESLGAAPKVVIFFLGALFSNKNLHSLSSKLPVLAVGCQTVDGMLLANGRHGSRVLFGFIALLSMGCHHNIAVLHCRLTLHTKPHSLTGTQMTKTDHVSSRALKVRMCAGIASFAICPCVASRTPQGREKALEVCDKSLKLRARSRRI